MKILIGRNVHWWNAEAAYACIIAKLLQDAGHSVFVLTRPDSLNEQRLKERGLRLVTHIDLNSNNPFRLFRAYRKLKKFLLEEHIELINPHRSEGFPLFVFAAWWNLHWGLHLCLGHVATLNSQLASLLRVWLSLNALLMKC